MSYHTHLLAIDVGFNEKEETSLDLLAEPQYLLDCPSKSEMTEVKNEIIFIDGKLLVSF